MYRIKVKCTNCGYENYIDIPTGQLIHSKRCPVCGCLAIEKSFGSYATPIKEKDE